MVMLDNIIVLKISSFFHSMWEEKIKIKAKRLLFFLLDKYMSDDSLTVKYTKSGLIYKMPMNI